MGDDNQVKTWAMILHLSVFASYLVPLAGIVAPIVIWQIKKGEMPELDAHGRIVTNWIISTYIYVAVCLLLSVVLIGVPLLFVLGALGIIFPIMGAVKASNGETWKYPLSIPFV